MGKELRQITTNQIPIWEDALRQGDIAKQCWEVVILKYQDIRKPNKLLKAKD